MKISVLMRFVASASHHRKFTFATGLILLVSLLSKGQIQGRARVDSLINSVSISHSDSVRTIIYTELGFSFTSINCDSGILFARKGLELAASGNDSIAFARLYNALGVNYRYKGDFRALDYHFKALKIFEKIDDKDEIAKTEIDIGRFYYYQRNYVKALDNYFAALRILEHNEKSVLATAKLYTDVAIVYKDEFQFDKALEYSDKALILYENENNKKGLAENFDINSDIYYRSLDFAKSYRYDIKALELYNSLGNSRGRAGVFIRMGNMYVDLYANGSNPKKYSRNDRPDTTRCLMQAIGFLDSSLALYHKLNDKTGVMSACRALARAHSFNGDYKTAFSFLKNYTELDDSLFSFASSIGIANLENEREKELQYNINKLANTKKNIVIVSISVVILLLVVIIFIVIVNNRNQKIANRLLKKTNQKLAIEKKRSDDLLLNILPAEVAEELKEKGSSEAKYFDNVTVLITDFKGFTTIAETMTPQALVGELDTCYKAFDSIISRHNIEKIKTVGDAYLAVAGLPLGDTKHAENIVNAAIEIKHFMVKRHEQMGNQTFEIRIGVHSGNVVAGIVGIKKFAYDIWGDTVNVAARMEQNSEPGKINISQSTYELVKDKYNCTFRGKILAKNKGEVNMYFVED